MTITGKLSGNISFTEKVTKGTLYLYSNGYSFIDLTNLNGKNFSNNVIDELEITMGGAYTYTCFDAFEWVKDAGTIPLVLTARAQTNVSCNGGSNGMATVNVAGGIPNYTYSWAPSGGTAQTATGLSAGTYTVTVTDGANNEKKQSFTILQPSSLLTATVTQNYASSANHKNATASVLASGGTPGYTYKWQPSGATPPKITGLGPGRYTVTVTDLNYCEITKPLILSSYHLLVQMGCCSLKKGPVATVAAG